MEKRIRHLRKVVLELTQAEFGAKIGLKPQAVADIESGRNALTGRNFNLICKTFSVNPEWLRDGVGEIFLESKDALIRNVAEEFYLDGKEILLVQTFLDLDPEQRQGVMAWITSFAKALAVQLGVDYPAREPVKPDKDVTPDEAADIVRQEMTDSLAAKKEATASQVFTGTNGTSKKSSRSP